MMSRLCLKMCVFAIIGTIGIASPVRSDRYEAAKQHFARLINSMPSSRGETDSVFHLREVKVDNVRFTIAGTCDATSIPPASTESPINTECKTGISVWFQLGDREEYVNPVNHKWQRKEQFYIWIESGVPVQIALFQNYPTQNKDSRQVFPDISRPETFATFTPNKPQRLPVKFEMDNDLYDEFMSMVVVRVDNPSLPLNSAVQQSPTVDQGLSGPGGKIRSLMEEQNQALLRFNNESLRNDKINGAPSRFSIVGPPENTSSSKIPDDVKVFLFGAGTAHAFEIELHKD